MDLGDDETRSTGYDESLEDDEYEHDDLWRLPQDRDVLPVWDSPHPLPLSGPAPTGFVPASTLPRETPRIPAELYAHHIMPAAPDLESRMNLGASSREARAGFVMRYGEAESRIRRAHEAYGVGRSGRLLLRDCMIDKEEDNLYPLHAVFGSALKGLPCHIIGGGGSGFYLVPLSEGLDFEARMCIENSISGRWMDDHSVIRRSGAKAWLHAKLEEQDELHLVVFGRFDTKPVLERLRPVLEILDIRCRLFRLRVKRVGNA